MQKSIKYDMQVQLLVAQEINVKKGLKDDNIYLKQIKFKIDLESEAIKK